VLLSIAPPTARHEPQEVHRTSFWKLAGAISVDYIRFYPSGGRHRIEQK